jgi:hypothetical protein
MKRPKPKFKKGDICTVKKQAINYSCIDYICAGQNVIIKDVQLCTWNPKSNYEYQIIIDEKELIEIELYHYNKGEISRHYRDVQMYLYENEMEYVCKL